MNTNEQPDSSLKRLRKAPGFKLKSFKRFKKNLQKKSIERIPAARHNGNGVHEENSNDSVQMQEKPADVIEIDSSEDERSLENRKRKHVATGNDVSKSHCKNNRSEDELLRNKPLTFEEFGFKFMEDESSNSNTRSGGYRAVADDEDEEQYFEILGPVNDEVLQRISQLNENKSQQGSRGTFTCEICNREVVSRYNLKRHMMIHTNEKPYRCEICNRKFRESSDMRKHMNVHVTGSRTFECNRCHRSFSTYKADKCYWCEEEGESVNLNPTHQNSAIKPVETETIIQEADQSEMNQNFGCSICGKLCYSDLILQMHIKACHKNQNRWNSQSSSPGTSDTDTDLDMPKKFGCTICPKKFRSKLFCEQHIEQHLKN